MDRKLCFDDVASGYLVALSELGEFPVLKSGHDVTFMCLASSGCVVVKGDATFRLSSSEAGHVLISISDCCRMNEVTADSRG